MPLNYFTYIGGAQDEVGLAITADSTQNARVTGFTKSGSGFLNTNPLGVPGGGTDAFYARIATSAGVASSTSILGGSGSDIGTSIVTDVSLNSYIAGETNSASDFPSSASAGQPSVTALQTARSGNSDIFISKLGSTVSGLSLVCPKNTTFNGATITACTPSAAYQAPNPSGVGSAVSFTFRSTTPAIRLPARCSRPLCRERMRLWPVMQPAPPREVAQIRARLRYAISAF